MPRRWATLTRLWAYRYLDLRDGPNCQICGSSPNGRLHDIDHIDGNPTNGDPSNLRLLCHSCNVARENQSRRHETGPDILHATRRLGHETPSVPPESERNNDNTNRAVGTQVARDTVDYQAGPPEMRANDLFEVPFRSWLLAQLADRPFITVQEAINSGAEVVGCATITASRYLAKLTSPAGPLQEQRDMLRTRIVTKKEQTP